MIIDNYIRPGDEISVMFRSVSVTGFRGIVLEVCNEEPGAREIIIRREGTSTSEDGAIGVREDQAVFSVRGGDSWVGVPCLLSIAEAEAKAGRAVVNERRRVQRRVPLFADQVEIQTRDASAWVEGSRLSGEEQLQARHNDAMRATSLREAVCKLVTSDEYGKLLTARERYPGSGTYGVIFWRKQLDHIERVGGPDIFIPKPTLTAKLSFPWLKPDAELTWASAPGGAKRIRVLFIGSDLVLTRLVGEPFIDFDPRLIPNQNNWIKPNDFEEAGEVVTQPAAATFYPHQPPELENHYAER